jgi:hypothetical protein
MKKKFKTDKYGLDPVPDLDPEPELKLFQNRNWNQKRNKSLRFHDAGSEYMAERRLQCMCTLEMAMFRIRRNHNPTCWAWAFRIRIRIPILLFFFSGF